jgi:hypothetical protein
MKAKKHKFIAVFALMAALALWLLWPTGETVPVAKASARRSGRAGLCHRCGSAHKIRRVVG